MKTLKNKIAAITIAIFFMLSMIASMMLMPTTSAHTPAWNIPTFAFIAATPNPIGVGQTATIGLWLTNVYDSEAITNNYRFQNFKLTITAPNGGVITETFPTATPDSFISYYYTPTATGTYNLTFTFPGQTITTTNGNPASAYINDTYLPSHASCTLTVQSTPLAPALSYPLPTAYWTRPISSQNTSWHSVASNFVYDNVAAYVFGATRYLPGVAAPSSGHIMWTDPINFGGYTGVNPQIGSTDAQAQSSPLAASEFYDGRSYEDEFINPIIIDGNLYYGLPISDYSAGFYLGAPPTDLANNGGYVDINLQTGQQVWKCYYTVNPSFGVVINVDTPNQYGAFGYLVAVSGTTWIVDNPYNGDWIFNITNVPAGWSGICGPQGEPLIYQLQVAPTGDWLALWNFTDVVADGPVNYVTFTGWRPVGAIINSAAEGSNAYSWNVTIPASEDLPSGSEIMFAYYNDLALCSNIPSSPFGPGCQFGGISPTGAPEPLTATCFALSLQAPTIGTKLWQQTYTTPDNITFEINSADPVNNVFIMVTKETMQFYGYNLNATGNMLYGPVGGVPPLSAYNYYSTVGMGTSTDDAYTAYGNFYVGGYGGILFCFNDLTGKIVWTYGNGGAGNNTNSGFNTPYGNYPCFVGLIADGIVYIYNGNHGNGNPIYKGETITALNATTGAEIWSEQAEVQVGGFEDLEIPVADGCLVYLNCYNMEVTCIGQGPSATTLQTPLNGVTQGGRLVIQGTVMDTSAGTQQTQQKTDFPNGVPCVSDASEGAWMDYVYQQFPMPTNVTGVPVTISAIDPNGNNIVLGTAYTDSSGLYSLEINTNNLLAGPGLYKVTANFAGSNSYWGSSAESTFVVSPVAPTPAPTAAPVTGLASTGTVELGILAVIIVIIIIGAVIILTLRKRP